MPDAHATRDYTVPFGAIHCHDKKYWSPDTERAREQAEEILRERRAVQIIPSSPSFDVKW